ncbi:hemerythrin domain-containing protein [Arthrobacter sp. UKPF54-2]|uniref:hemerythrin domain-containing protein n=1 Tax=Arthrobacter sp. UKPF54-2 TaxID=2600159 RepID=UPI0011B110B6|nr:hemerythrin domain-containing protein [Arthrobacter sp. UKPF54-2]QDY91130.1 hemerythrin domain-containing protein [Arthrobacter sp. UKPF54-2]
MDMPVPKNAEDEARALAAVEAHHAGMLKRLRALIGALTEAVSAHNTVAEHDAHEVLVEWCETELVPHALAEEGPLYSGAGATPEGRLLVAGMLAEHQVIVSLVERLRSAQGVDAAVAAAGIGEVFALHLDKENRLLMPLIVESPGLSLAESVAGLHELVGEASVHDTQHGSVPPAHPVNG